MIKNHSIHPLWTSASKFKEAGVDWPTVNLFQASAAFATAGRSQIAL